MGDVPTRFPVSINDHPYQLQIGPDYQRGSPTSIRPTMDTSARAAGGSIAPGIAWRRSQQTWAGGAGQTNFDEDSPTSTSDESRFLRSVGIDVWTRRRLSLLRGVTNPTASAVKYIASKFAALPDLGTYGHLYATTADSGNNIRRYVLNGASAPTVATVSGSYGPSHDIATNGSAIYAATDNGLYSISGTTATILASSAATTHTFVNVCNGRLLASKTDGALLEYATNGATTTTFLGAPAATTWIDATGVPQAILVAGTVGHTSTLYRITYDDSTGALKAALTPATDWPQGELIYCLLYHMGWLVIGTSLGVRLASVDQSGNVSTGPVITAPGPVRGLAADGRYVWFGWSLAATSTTDGALFGYAATTDGDHPAGTGRLDLANFVLPEQPAYATDVVDTSGLIAAANFITDVARINGRTWFVADNTVNAFYENDSLLVSAGWIESSLIEFGFEGTKIATDVEVRHDSGQGLITVTLTTEDGSSTVLGSLGTSGTFQSEDPIPAGNVDAEAHRLRFDFLATSPLGADVPVSWWKMQETSGTVATDTEALHNGTYSGVLVNQTGPGGALPKAVAFGPADVMTVADAPDYEGATAFSFEAWVNVPTLSETSTFRLSKEISGGTNMWGMTFGGSATNGVEGHLYNTGGTIHMRTTVYHFNTTGWHHVVMVAVPSSSLHLWVDGVRVKSTTAYTGTYDGVNDYDFTIQNFDTGSTTYLVAGVAYYNYALADASITAHYAGLTISPFSAALRRWALRAVPVARTYEVIQLPLIFSEMIKAGADNGEDYPFDTLAEYDYLLGLKQSREVVSYNELGRVVSGVIDELTLGNVTRINESDGQRAHFDGELLLKIWTV